jgi:hypothetical protein
MIHFTNANMFSNFLSGISQFALLLHRGRLHGRVCRRPVLGAQEGAARI